MDMESAPTVCNSKLWPPESDASLGTSHQPDSTAVFTAIHDGKAEYACVELFRSIEISNLQDQFAYAVHWNAGTHRTTSYLRN